MSTRPGDMDSTRILGAALEAQYMTFLDAGSRTARVTASGDIRQDALNGAPGFGLLFSLSMCHFSASIALKRDI